MRDSNHRTTGWRMTLDEFLAFSGWIVTPGARRDAMQLALDFFQEKFDHDGPMEKKSEDKHLMDEMQPESPFFAVRGQKPYSRDEVMQNGLPSMPFPRARGRKAARLTAWMQAINFRCNVSQAWARLDQIFKSFRARHDHVEKQPTGNWYTGEFEPWEGYGLHPQQDVPWFYRVKAPFQYLTSTVSDAASWLPANGAEAWSISTKNKYFEGGGTQYFVPHPEGLVVLWEPKYVCRDPQAFQARVVDNGQCVRFVQVAAGVPHTSRWKCGLKVRGANQIPVGAAIATFVNGRYPNQSHGNHAAIYAGQDAAGIWVWDQWTGKPVSKRQIKFKLPADFDRSNNGNAFSVID